MLSRQTKLKLRRLMRRRRRQVEDIGSATEESFERHIFKRLIKLVEVRRFLLGWIGLLSLLCLGVILQTRALSPHYQAVVPAGGGQFREGIVGTFTNANPLYAQNSIDSSVARLVFAGLFKYDQSGKLVPDVAESYSFDETETLYTVKLKNNVRWHDGEPLTAKDVAYTFGLIQNPEVKSYLLASWRGVVVKAVDDHTVTFKLPNALSAFPHSLTTGIVPEHVLSKISPNQLRSSNFNNELPIGAGPFSFQAVEVESTGVDDTRERIALNSSSVYHGGAPKLERLTVRTYPNEAALTKAFDEKEVDAMAGISIAPESLDPQRARQYSVALTSQVMVFFRNSQDILKDPVVRRALVLGTNKQEVFQQLPYPLLSIDEPVLRSQIGYDKTLAQITGRRDEANAMLDAAGWVRDPNTKIRTKAGVALKFRLFSAANSEFTSVSGSLQKQWRELGADVEVVLQPDDELQSTVSSHNYDALLYGISVGPDPDVYAYWHSTQTDVRSETRLNLSEYKSPAADRALEAGRTRSDVKLRTVKYRPFLEAWRNEAPALAMYQPRYLYIASDALQGFDVTVAHTAADRYAHVEKWTVRKESKNE